MRQDPSANPDPADRERDDQMSITNLVSPRTQRLRVSPARRARQYAATPTALVAATTISGPATHATRANVVKMQ
jgi:hypothetical protein